MTSRAKDSLPDVSHYEQADHASLRSAVGEFSLFLRPEEVRTALDVGSRDAKIALGLAAFYPDANVYAFECNPAAVQICRRNVAGHPRVSLVEKAVADTDGTLTFHPIDPERTVTPHQDGNIGASSLYAANPAYPNEQYVQNEISVSCTTLATWMEQNHVGEIDVLWMDLQGAEVRALMGLGDKLSAVKIIHTEVQYREMYLGAPLFDELDRFLQNNGFALIKQLYTSEWFGDVLYVRQDLAHAAQKRMAAAIPLDQIFTSLPHVKESFKSEDWFTAESYYPYYERISKALQPNSLLEIGSLQGFSLITMLRGAPSLNSITWIDSEEYIAGSNRMCHENLDFYLHTYEPGRTPPRMQPFSSCSGFLDSPLRGSRPDLIHIDGEHTYDGKMRDLMICYRLQPKYIMLDDFYHIPEVQNAIRDWAASMQIPFFVVDTFHRGLAVFDLSPEQDALNQCRQAGLPIREVVSAQRPPAAVPSPADTPAASGPFVHTKKDFVIEIKYGGLGDHLFFSHLPRIAKTVGGYDRVLLSRASEYRHDDYRRLVWENNPFVDGFCDERREPPVFEAVELGFNLLDKIMIGMGLDDGLRDHEPEIHYTPRLIAHLADKSVYDPNFVSFVGDLDTQTVQSFFSHTQIAIDYQMALRNKSLPLSDVPGVLTTQTLEEFCDVVASCGRLYCLTSGTATLAAALGKSAVVLHERAQKPMFQHSRRHHYVALSPAFDASPRQGPSDPDVLRIVRGQGTGRSGHASGLTHTVTAQAQARPLRLPQEAGSVAAILCDQVLEHLTDPAGALAEMARVLRPSGLLRIQPAGSSAPTERGYVLGFTDAWYAHHAPGAGLRMTASGPDRVEAVKCRPAGMVQTLIDHDSGCVPLYAEAATASLGAADFANALRYYEDGCELNTDDSHLSSLHRYFQTAGIEG